jgi:hypothetical protein
MMWSSLSSQLLPGRRFASLFPVHFPDILRLDLLFALLDSTLLVSQQQSLTIKGQGCYKFAHSSSRSKRLRKSWRARNSTGKIQAADQPSPAERVAGKEQDRIVPKYELRNVVYADLQQNFSLLLVEWIPKEIILEYRRHCVLDLSQSFPQFPFQRTNSCGVWTVSV